MDYEVLGYRPYSLVAISLASGPHLSQSINHYPEAFVPSPETNTPFLPPPSPDFSPTNHHPIKRDGRRMNMGDQKEAEIGRFIEQRRWPHLGRRRFRGKPVVPAT
nr:hypothetical protein Iba_chr02aCG9460 [Ipomoea batatas]